LAICGARSALMNPSRRSTRWAIWVSVSMPRSPTMTARPSPKRSATAAAAAGTVLGSAVLPRCSSIATGRPSGAQISP